MRRVESASRSGVRLHRPAAAGGPPRLESAGPRRRRPPDDERRRADPAVNARSAASVSFVTSPAQTSSHSASSVSLSFAESTSAATWRKNIAPRSSSAARTACAVGVSSAGSGGGNSRCARSANPSTIQPSSLPSAPAPHHTTSPAAHSSSSIAGE